MRLECIIYNVDHAYNYYYYYKQAEMTTTYYKNTLPLPLAAI